MSSWKSRVSTGWHLQNNASQPVSWELIYIGSHAHSPQKWTCNVNAIVSFNWIVFMSRNKGVKLPGCWLYWGMNPCPTCGKLLHCASPRKSWPIISYNRFLYILYNMAQTGDNLKARVNTVMKSRAPINAGEYFNVRETGRLLSRWAIVAATWKKLRHR